MKHQISVTYSATTTFNYTLRKLQVDDQFSYHLYIINITDNSRV